MHKFEKQNPLISFEATKFPSKYNKKWGWAKGNETQDQVNTLWSSMWTMGQKVGSSMMCISGCKLG
jgi:hypothetical protein